MNSKKLILIGGLPATGKTTLMKQIRETLGEHTKNKYGLLRYDNFRDYIVFGIYDDSLFSGTDKLSMAVMPDAMKFLEFANDKDVLIEGDRLFTQKFIDHVKSIGYDVKIIICTVNSMEEIVKRFKQRGKMQSQKFLLSRYTKIINITDANKVTRLDTTKPIKNIESVLTFI